MAEKVTCPYCGKLVKVDNFCEECGNPLTKAGKIERSSRETEEQKKEKKRIEDDEKAEKAKEWKHKKELTKMQYSHEEIMQELRLADKRKTKLIVLLILVFICIIGASTMAAIFIVKKHHDNLPYQRNSEYKIWKNPVTVKEYNYFVNETNYISKTAKSQNYVIHVTDEKMELADSVDYNSMENNSPIVFVSFFDAVEYCNFRSNDEGLKEYYNIQSDGKILINEKANGYRLPTAKEWTDSAKKFKELRDDIISEWCFDIYENNEQYRVIKKYQKGIKVPAEYQSFSDSEYGVDSIGFRVVRK